MPDDNRVTYDRIYLHLREPGDDVELADFTDVSWSVERVNDADVEYIHASQLALAQARLDAMEEAATMCDGCEDSISRMYGRMIRRLADGKGESDA